MRFYYSYRLKSSYLHFVCSSSKIKQSKSDACLWQTEVEYILHVLLQLHQNWNLENIPLGTIDGGFIHHHIYRCWKLKVGHKGERGKVGRSVFKVSKCRQNLLRENYPDHLHYISNAHPAACSHLPLAWQQEKIRQTRRKWSWTERKMGRSPIWHCRQNRLY